MEIRAPVCLFIFNRPETTQFVFQRISELRPKRLFIIADGPRPNRFGEIELCDQVREIVSHISWPCEVHKNYSDLNLGCKSRFSTGLDWVFSQAEEAIILEDDTLPDLTFFRFCDELLEKYRDNKKIMHISGNYFQAEKDRTSQSYYFSRYPHCWGWATWKRAWSKYDENMLKWPLAKRSGELNEFLKDEKTVRYWSKIFSATYNNLVDSWAYRWVLACWLEGGLTVIPNGNLVTHIGAGENATHTKSYDKNIDRLPVNPMTFPLHHPSVVARDESADLYVDRNVFRIHGLIGRAMMKIAQLTGMPR